MVDSALESWDFILTMVKFLGTIEYSMVPKKMQSIPQVKIMDLVKNQENEAR